MVHENPDFFFCKWYINYKLIADNYNSADLKKYLMYFNVIINVQLTLRYVGKYAINLLLIGTVECTVMLCLKSQYLLFSNRYLEQSYIHIAFLSPHYPHAPSPTIFRCVQRQLLSQGQGVRAGMC